MTTSDSGSIVTPQGDASEQPQMPPEAQEPVVADADGPETLPILPVTDAVLFPSMLMPLVISGENWIKLIDDAALSNKTLALFWQHRETEHFEADALSPVGTIALLARMARLPDGKLQVLLQGQTRSQIEEIVSSDPYPVARVSPLTEDTELTRQIEGLERTARDTFKHIIQISQTLPDELSAAADNAPSPGILADMVAVNLNLQQHQQQAVLNALDVAERLHIVLSYLEREREILEIGQKAQSEVSKTQREYVLRQQLEAIKRELGETDDQAAELAELRRQLDEANLPDEPRKEAERELKRLERVPPAAPEYSVARTYLDVILGVPWDKSTDDNYDLAIARQVLDEDHYDLERVKDRIIEYLAVRKLQHEQGEDRLRGPILCLVGPPGVGKTSLGQSVARALDRKFMRVALGGIRDESEIRGFRRTYVGALPGRIIQGISRIGSNNPVLMLDEVDKLTVSLQGDPAAALLELLDPEQNRAFVDRYLDVPFDLSRVLFICTANRIDTIPPALLDRMEVLELAGYTEMEKLMISRRYLVPRQQTEQGLGNRELHVTDETLQRLIREYTRESGVRNLERQIGSVFRKMATRLAEGKAIPKQIDASDLDELLEPPRYRFETLLGEDEVGITTGLAWTPTGGDVLFVESRVIPGNGQLILTGQLGDVMRESARAAMTYARSRGDELGIDPEFAQRSDVHIHVPAGSIPKDGPSAGITIACALISALIRRKAHKHVGMTGEITLSGKVLPIGGVKEKILAAQRVGVQTVLLPSDNRVDLREVPAETREQMEIVLVQHMDEVLPRVLYAE
jgi:ATP-dependent Lon protease